MKVSQNTRRKNGSATLKFKSGVYGGHQNTKLGTGDDELIPLLTVGIGGTKQPPP